MALFNKIATVDGTGFLMDVRAKMKMPPRCSLGRGKKEDETDGAKRANSAKKSKKREGNNVFPQSRPFILL